MSNNSNDAGGFGDLSGIINLLMSNPALMSGIASLIGGMNGIGKKPPGQSDCCDIPKPPEECREDAPPPPPCPPKNPPPPPGICPPKPPCRTSKYADETALLIALKPFMSKKRCEMIDTIIKISKILELFPNGG